MESDVALAEFLESLEEARAVVTCVACRKMFKEPVKYLTCLHTVCASHTGPKGNRFCAVCRADVRETGVVPDEALRRACDALTQLMALHKKPEQLSSTLSSSTSTITDTNKKTTKRVSNAETKHALEKKNVKGETPLQVACRLLKISKVLELLQKGANPNTKDNAGWTPLHEVVQKGSREIVNILLNHKALPDIPGLDNETPLHEAIRYGHKEIAIDLVKNGADINAKNIKGETPLTLADEAMKIAILDATVDIVQTQSENIKEISLIQMSCDFVNMHVLCTFQSKTLMQNLKKLSKVHSITIESKFSNKVTHLIVESQDDNTASPSVEILQAIVNGVWILNTGWIENSTEEHLENFEEYEIAGIFTKYFNGPKKARFSKYKKLPGLFDGCHFYLHGFTKDYELSKSLILSKVVLSKIITDGGGKLLRRVPNPESIPPNEKTVPYHAPPGGKLAKCSHYIIFSHMYQPMYNMEHLKALPIGWLIECIQSFEIIDP